MTYTSKETITYRHNAINQLRQRIAEIDVELARVYDAMWQCSLGEKRKIEQFTDRRNALERERNNKERELEIYL